MVPAGMASCLRLRAPRYVGLCCCRHPFETGFLAVDVLEVGGLATAQTLQSGLYPNILLMLKNTVPGPQWSSQARYELDTWAHGPNGVHNGVYSNFLGGSVPSSFVTLGPSGVIGPAPSAGGADPFGISAGLGSLGTTLTNDLKRTLYFVSGGVLMLAGLAVLTLILVRGTAPAVAKTAALATPQGRAASVGLGAVQRQRTAQTNRKTKEAKAEVASNRRYFKASTRKRSVGQPTRGEVARSRAATIRTNKERNEEPPF